MKKVIFNEKFEKSIFPPKNNRGLSAVFWDDDHLAMSARAFQELKHFFQSIEFRKGDKIRTAHGALDMLYIDLYVVDFNHESYFCVSGNGLNYEVKFEYAIGCDK